MFKGINAREFNFGRILVLLLFAWIIYTVAVGTNDQYWRARRSAFNAATNPSSILELIATCEQFGPRACSPEEVASLRRQAQEIQSRSNMAAPTKLELFQGALLADNYWRTISIGFLAVIFIYVIILGVRRIFGRAKSQGMTTGGS